MLTTIISTAEKFNFFEEIYPELEPTFVKADDDGSVYFTLNFNGMSSDHIASLMFIFGQDYQLRQNKKNYETINIPFESLFEKN